MKIIDLGLCPYREAQQTQLDRHTKVLDGAEDTLFLLEHPRVITVGKGGGLEHLHVRPEFLASQGIDLVHVTRGGNITCHFPGQLVGYPIFRVDRRPGGVKRFFHDMEETVIRSLSWFGLSARRWEGRAGVWTASGKVCSMGIAVKKWVTYHGLALNVGENTSLFDMITLCGLADTKAASVHGELKALGRVERPGMQEIKDVLVQEFREVFADSKMA
ncbi:MAG: lipoyl(octanoyl) transferase LipB [Proteobacteria bacterium]|nr:lipoyl(octanoyl) transferase LipB [Pseudomonadota bacterium]